MSDGIALSISQFIDAWRLFGQAWPGSRIESTAGADYVFTGLPIPFFNVAILTGRQLSGAALAAQGHGATRWASDKGAPWLLIVTHEALEPGIDAAAVLDGCGLAPLLPMTGMIAQVVAPATRVPDSLQLDEPRDDEGCTALIDINSAAYGMDLSASRPAYGSRAFWAGHVAVLGRADGAAATSAAVLMAGGYRYVAMVATDPVHQKRGFAEAAMRRALTIAEERHGPRPTFLHATDAGRPIYARMGYEAVSSHTCFIDKRFLAGH